AAIATRALKSAPRCFLFTPTSHASLDRSALSLSHCPENQRHRTMLCPVACATAPPPWNTITDLDLDTLAALEPPRGYGSD
ncbi:MAG: hypothetical protein ACREFP_25850, partial [Acetobacteraceae bacterium]